MNIQHTKCPGCGGTVFSEPVTADVNQPESTINCEYCGSQFRVNNPNYRPDPVVYTTINTYNTAYENVSDTPYKSSGWRNASDGAHKVTRILSYIIGGLMAPFVIGLWLVSFMNAEGLPIILPIIFTGLMLFFFFLANRCGKELKRRRGA